MRELASLLLYAAPIVLVELRRAIPEMLGLTEHAPDPVVIACVLAALRARPDAAVLFAAVCGLLGDVPSGTPFGLGGARLALVTVLAGTLRRHVDTETPFVPSLVVLAAALVDRTLAAIVLDAAGNVPLVALLARGAIDAFFTVGLVPLIWPAGELLVELTRPRR